MEIKEIIEELEKWAEEDKENHSVFLIATKDMGEQVSTNVTLIGKARNLIDAYLNEDCSPARMFEKMLRSRRTIRLMKRIAQEMKDDVEEVESEESK